VRLLTVGHSYVVALNRRLANEIARISRGRWQVTAVAPQFMRGDLRPLHFETDSDRCRVETLPFRGLSIHTMLYGRRLRQILSERWNLVHCWEEPYVFAGAQVARHTPRETPFVFTTAQNLAKRYPPPFNFLEQYAVSRAAGWNCVGHTCADVLLQRTGYGDRPHRVIPLGVDTDTFRPDPTARAAMRTTLGWRAGGEPVIGFLGRFVEEKGVRLLMSAIDALPEGTWRALFVGTGPLTAQLERWARGYPDRVRIVTGAGHRDVPAYVNAMDMLCAPSQTTARWKEQFGRMLVEAAACGVPVIGSDSGEIPHVIGADGLIVAERERAAWTSAIGTVCDSPALRRELSLRGRERACASFAWPVVAREHIDFFEEVLERTPQTRRAA